MTQPLLVSEQHPRSRRWAVLTDEGASVWLYLTEPDGERPVADCWLLNLVPAPTDLSAYRTSKGPPPATRHYTAESPAERPSADAIRFQWSVDGDSVAIFMNGDVLGFIAAGRKRGFSKHLTSEGPYGLPMDDELYALLFRQAGDS